ncbi:MAG: lamin tail domain-containing protein, partial [Candidatus Fermentibacteria bacterium]
MILGTDTIPPFGFALLFELDYPDAPVYDIPAGTLILTTADHSICNGLAASSDPLTLFNPQGTADSNAVSTYGTPLPSDIWQNRDDDGLDDIPFDPGENRTAERFPWTSPDQEAYWSAGPEGGTPGSHAQAPPDTLNISCDSVWTIPEEPLSGEIFQLNASFTCTGNTSPSSGTLVLFLENQGDSLASPDEILAEYSATVLQPGYTDVFTTSLSLEQGWFLPSAAADVPMDEYPEDDFASSVLAVGGGIDPVITEVLCNPLDEDQGEFLEIYYPGPGIFSLCGCSFTDGDALDIVCEWYGIPLSDPDALYGCCIPSGHYGLIMDPEYTVGLQEYDLAESTFVFSVENTTIGNGLTATDPLTLYSMNGTAQINVLSTYGTPLQFDDPLLCDDDGLDGIPFDPGEFHSVQRKSSELPDEEYCWAVSPEGGTPGCPAVFTDTTDAAVDSLILTPSQPDPGQPLEISAIVSNCGTSAACGLEVTIFIDSNADSLPQPDEICCFCTTDSLYPGETETVSVTLNTPVSGYYLAAAAVYLPGDMVPENDVLLTSFRSGEGVPLVVTEVLCNPSSEDHDEFIEIYYPGPGVFDISGCRFTDGDALDEIVCWNNEIGILQDPDAVESSYLLQGCYGLILDREYTDGTQPYDFPAGSVIFTTGNTTLGDGLQQNDPVTLYASSGTASIDVMSTYGTPLDNDDPLSRDDDGLDGIPFDPGEDNSVQRKHPEEPDHENNWFASPEGPSPGSPSPAIIEGVNGSAAGMECVPPMGPGGEMIDILAAFTNSGTDTIPSGSMTVYFYEDTDESGTPSSAEMINSYLCGPVAPGDTILTDCEWNSCSGEMYLIALAVCQDDSIPADDTTSCDWNSPGPVIINEIMYSPSPGNPEWVEIVNRSSNPVRLTGWTFEDSRDRFVFCTCSMTLQPDSFAVLVSDSSAFRTVWPDVQCPLLQPAGWPVLNNNTQQGMEWADIL